MLDLDITAAASEGRAQADRAAASWDAIVDQLLTDEGFRKRMEQAAGASLDVSTTEGMAALQQFALLLSDRAEAQHEHRVEEEVQRLATRAEAQERFAASRADEAAVLPVESLGALLADDIPEEPYVVDGLLHAGGNALFTAKRKSGKSTTVANLIRTLVDGDPFLGEFESRQTRRVVLVDLELSRANIQRWLRDQGVKNVDAVTVVALRGQARAFNILDDATRARLADQLRGHDTIILDPLRPLADALGLNEHTEMGRLLEAFDALKQEAGISEGVIVHHHGHGSDRARGDSRLEDWPDAIWRLTRDDDEDPRAFRYFSAFGRDVDVDKGIVEMDASRRLRFRGDVQTGKTDRLVVDVVNHLREHGPARSGDLATAVRGVTKNNTRQVIDAGVSQGLLTARKEGTTLIVGVIDPIF